MIAHVTGGKALPKEIAEQIIDRTDGVPLFVEELTKAVIESGMVDRGRRRYAWQGPGPPLAIPTSLHASLLARLDRLGPAAGGGADRRGDRPRVLARADRRVARPAGAATGRGAGSARRTPGWSSRAARRRTPNISVQARTGAGCRLRQLAAQPTPESAPPHCRNAGEPLSRRLAAQPALLAQHCAEAGLAEKAVVYWLKAGQQALARSAMAEAVAQLRKGLDGAGRSAGRPMAPATGAGSANRARIGTDCHERLFGGRSRRDPRPGARAG